MTPIYHDRPERIRTLGTIHNFRGHSFTARDSVQDLFKDAVKFPPFDKSPRQDAFLVAVHKVTPKTIFTVDLLKTPRDRTVHQITRLIDQAPYPAISKK